MRKLTTTLLALSFILAPAAALAKAEANFVEFIFE